MTNKEFDAIWPDLQSGIYAYIYSAIKSRERAEDLLHDVYVKAHIAISSLRDNSKIMRWLLKITKNRLINYWRDNSRTVIMDSETIDNIISKYEALPPDDTADSITTKVVVEYFFRSLPNDFQQILYLHLFLGVKISEIAKVSGKDYAALRKRVYRAKKVLARAFADEDNVNTTFFPNDSSVELRMNNE